MLTPTNSKPSVRLLVFFIFYAILWTAGLGFVFNLGHANSAPLLHQHCGDQHIFTLIAQGVLDGKTIYTDLWDHKGPLLFLLYAPFIWMTGGEQHLALFIAQCLSSFIVLLYSWKLARLYLSEKLALLLVILIPASLGSYSANVTDLFISLQLLSLYYFIHKYKTGSRRPILLVLGVCTTIALYSKFILCAFWIPFFFVELYQILKHKGKGVLVKELLKCTLGFALISTLVFVLVSPQIVWENYIAFNQSYGSQEASIIFSDPAEVLSRLIWPHPIGLQLLFYAKIPFVLVGLGLLLSSFILWPEYKKNLLSIITCFLAMILTLMVAAATPVMREYYYISLHPFFILSLIFMLYWASRLLPRLISSPRIRMLLYRAMILMTILALAGFILRYQSEKRDVASKTNQINHYIAQHIKPQSKIISIGFSPTSFDLYHELDTLPQSPYLYQPYIPKSTYNKIEESSLELIAKGAVDHVILPMSEKDAIYEQLIASPLYEQRDLSIMALHADWIHFAKKKSSTISP